tara:strand:+ start:376 stop:528 length:153 start_codon:yes stop_codon:yes gene_type:complete
MKLHLLMLSGLLFACGDKDEDTAVEDTAAEEVTESEEESGSEESDEGSEE